MSKKTKKFEKKLLDRARAVMSVMKKLVAEELDGREEPCVDFGEGEEDMS